MTHRLLLRAEGATWGWPAGDTLDWELVAAEPGAASPEDVQFALRAASGPLPTSGPATYHPDQARMELALAALNRVGFEASPLFVAPPPPRDPCRVYERGNA